MGAVGPAQHEQVRKAGHHGPEGALQGTVWNTGCASWYLDATGRNSMLWPDWTWRFRQRTASFDPNDFKLTQRTPGKADPVTP
jgi:hypothetical protein